LVLIAMLNGSNVRSEEKEGRELIEVKAFS
jgi:hypothetical protein